MTDTPIEKRHWNALYLLLATSTIFMTLVVGIQPLFLSEVIGVSVIWLAADFSTTPTSSMMPSKCRSSKPGWSKTPAYS